MEKAKKASSIKKLETELKEEKQAELTRCVIYHDSSHHMINLNCRRKEVTMERTKAAEERKRLEEDKAKMGARKAARLRRKAGRSKKVNG